MSDEATDIRTIEDIINDAAREAAIRDNYKILDDIQYFVLQGISIHDITVLSHGTTIEGRRAVPKAVYELVNNRFIQEAPDE